MGPHGMGGRRHGSGPGMWPHGGWPPFGRGRRARRGDVRTAVLALLAEDEMNGYQVMQEIRTRSGGLWEPSSGSVYPALQQLADEGLVRVRDDGQQGKRVFSLTGDGRACVDQHPERFAEPWTARFDADAGETARDLRDSIGQLAGAFLQVAQVGTADQLDRAKRVVSDARRALYRILAEDDHTEQPGGGR